MTLQGLANLDPRGMIGRIFVKGTTKRFTILNIYIGFRPCGFREEDYKPMLDNDAPRGVANLGPRDTVGRIYKGGN